MTLDEFTNKTRPIFLACFFAFLGVLVLAIVLRDRRDAAAMQVAPPEPRSRWVAPPEPAPAQQVQYVERAIYYAVSEPADPELPRDALRAYYFNQQREQAIRVYGMQIQANLEIERIKTDRALWQQRSTYNIYP